MIKFYKNTEVPAFKRLLHNPMGYQFVRNDIPSNFYIKLNGSSSTIENFFLYRIDLRGNIQYTLTLSTDFLSYNSTHDLIQVLNGTYPYNLEPGLYQFYVKTDEDDYKSEPFKIGNFGNTAEFIYLINGGILTTIIGKNISFVNKKALL